MNVLVHTWMGKKIRRKNKKRTSQAISKIENFHSFMLDNNFVCKIRFRRMLWKTCLASLLSTCVLCDKVLEINSRIRENVEEDFCRMYQTTDK